MTSRGSLTLAALASAAVPGLDPDSVVGVVPTRISPFDVAFVQDREHRRWVIRCPRTPAASAQLEQSAALLALLARRLTMPVPAVKGWAALPEGGRAAVHSYLTGRMVELPAIAPGSTLATGLGRSLALLHNLDVQVYEEAGVPVYDAETYRTRRLAELDRAAATGRVPTGLLGRWERILDDASLWSFTTTPTHGRIRAGTVLATPDVGEEPDVKAFLDWESAQVADPADDLAPLFGELDPEAFDTVLEAYAYARVERPDRNLQQRAALVNEMQLVRTMMAAVAADDEEGAERCATQLRRLDDRLAREEDAAEAERIEAERAAAPMAVPPGAGDDVGAPAQQTASLPTSGGQTDEAVIDEPDEAVQLEHPSTPTPIEADESTATTVEDSTSPVADDDAQSHDHGSSVAALDEDEDDDVVPLDQDPAKDPKGLNR